MSIIISNIRLPFDVPASEAIACALHQYQLSNLGGNASIFRQSIDVRHGRVTKVYSICLNGIPNEQELTTRIGSPAVRCKTSSFPTPVLGTRHLCRRPIIVGAGPAGLFAAYTLALHGYTPLLVERGDPILIRDKAVALFSGGGTFDPDSNIQFGEGGAGAYSDGKLTTRINDPLCESVLHTLVRHGAPDDILRQAKPHIGTDILKNVVRSMREHMIESGAEVWFRTALTALRTDSSNRLTGARIDDQWLPCERLVLAIGHSARDTFAMLRDAAVSMEAKPFSVGARIEHRQSDIDRMLYGKHAGHPALPPAEYTLSQRENGRACYSFCMCPGGHVVAAQSEPDSIVTNGMSFQARNGNNANSAIVVSVDSSDFGSSDPLAGIAFQRNIEQRAFGLTQGKGAPCQCVGDFLEGRITHSFGTVQPTYPRGVVPGEISPCLPSFVCAKMQDGLRAFHRRMPGFAMADAVLTAPETRTSSPVRLTRGKDFCSISHPGLMPCGEGAGYAGGIMSAAVDGIRVAHQIMHDFAPV